MGLYVFRHKISQEVREVFFRMNDEKIYKGDNGLDDNWERVFTPPNPAVNSSIANPFSQKDYNRLTDSKKETLGSLMDRSKEFSEKRKQKLGVKTDPQKKKYWDQWNKARGGKRKVPQRYLE